MPSLKDFIAALQAGWFPALAAIVGCSIIVLGDYYELPYLDETPELILRAAVVIGVFAFSILVANVAYIPVLIWKAIRRSKNKREIRGRLVKEIEAAPDTEKAILAYLVTSGRKAFAATFDDRSLAPLVSKGIVIKLGGTNSILEWPYIVQEDVWHYLVEHRDQFLLEIPDDARDPFHWSGRNW